MYKTKAYSAASATSPLASTSIARRDPTAHDVQIEILFYGHQRLEQTEHPGLNLWQNGPRGGVSILDERLHQALRTRPSFPPPNLCLCRFCPGLFPLDRGDPAAFDGERQLAVLQR